MTTDREEVSTLEFVDTSAGRISSNRRRRWPEALKRQIVAETLEPGSSYALGADAERIPLTGIGHAGFDRTLAHRAFPCDDASAFEWQNHTHRNQILVAPNNRTWGGLPAPARAP